MFLTWTEGEDSTFYTCGSIRFPGNYMYVLSEWASVCHWAQVIVLLSKNPGLNFIVFPKAGILFLASANKLQRESITGANMLQS